MTTHILSVSVYNPLEPIGLFSLFFLAFQGLLSYRCLVSIYLFLLKSISLESSLLRSESEWCWNTQVFVDMLMKKARGYPSSPRRDFCIFPEPRVPLSHLSWDNDSISVQSGRKACQSWYTGAIDGIKQYLQCCPNALWQYFSFTSIFSRPRRDWVDLVLY